MAAVLAAVLHGISHRLEATAPVNGRASRGGDEDFPGDLLMALARIERSVLLAQYFPAHYLRLYADLKRGEYGEMIDAVFGREYDFYA